MYYTSETGGKREISLQLYMRPLQRTRNVLESKPITFLQCSRSTHGEKDVATVPSQHRAHSARID